MLKSRFFTICDEHLSRDLEVIGFSIGSPGEYLRETNSGRDRVLIDPILQECRFFVLVSYYPSYMERIDSLSGAGTEEEQGFPCGPYLTPVLVSSRRYTWGFKSPGSLAVTLGKVELAFRDVVLPWLESLRDPSRFAAEVDPVAALYSGFAHEFAGEVDEAESRYREYLQRLMSGLDSGVSESEYASIAGKQLLFVAAKLAFRDERVERISNLVGPVPRVLPLEK